MSKCPTRHVRRPHGGFTLVELLVVVGIIAVLIAIIMPALSRAREASRATKCLSNMHQLSLLLVVYINENGGWLPVQSNPEVIDFADPSVYQSTNPVNWSWLSDFIPYFNNSPYTAAAVWVCPTALSLNSPSVPPVPPSATSYLANAAVIGRKLSRITNVSSVVWLQEQRFVTGAAWLRPCSAGGTPPEYQDWCNYNGIDVGQDYGDVHFNPTFTSPQGGGNVAYVDGHADYRPNGSLHPSDFGLVGIPGISTSNDPNTVSLSTLYFGSFDN